MLYDDLVLFCFRTNIDMEKLFDRDFTKYGYLEM